MCGVDSTLGTHEFGSLCMSDPDFCCGFFHVERVPAGSTTAGCPNGRSVPSAQSVSRQPDRGVSTSTSGLHRESWLWWH